MAGRYKILDHIGAGGVGAVYKAYDTQLDRYVAIKRLLSREEADRADSTTSTLKKEAASLATLQHPNIVSIYDLASDDEGLFIVMELLESDDLADWLKRSTLELGDFKEFASQTLEGILTAHQMNILHRDLKPENIKVARLPGGRFQAKIVDFGLARMSYASRKQSEDQSGNVMGSIYYMAPEQFVRRPLDGRTDLYSLGCVFYQTLAGRRPFDGATVTDVMEAHLQHRVQNLAEVCPGVPVPICEWVMWMMNQDPVHRPANAQAALDHLRALINAGWFNVAVAPEPMPQEMPSPPPARTSARVPVSASGAVRSATGTQRPVSSGYRPPGAVVRQDAPQAADPTTVAPIKKKPIWLFIVGGAIVAAVAVWMLLPKFLAAGKPNASASKNTTQNIYGLREQAKDFLIDGAVLHYRAGIKMEPWLNSGEPKRDVKPGDLIWAWHDLEPRAGDGTLGVADRKKEIAPKYAVMKPDGFKDSIGVAQFDFGDTLWHGVDKARSEAKDYPFGEKTKNKGVTIVMVVHPRLTDKEQMLFKLRNQDGGGDLIVRAFPNNEFHCIARTRGKDGKDTIKEDKIGGRSMKGFSLLTVTWDGKNNKIMMVVRSPDGNKGRREFGAPKDCPVLNELHISEFSKDAAHQPDPTDKFAGEIAEIAVWPFPMDWDPRSLQDQHFAEFYLTTPGKQFE